MSRLLLLTTAVVFVLTAILSKFFDPNFMSSVMGAVSIVLALAITDDLRKNTADGLRNLSLRTWASAAVRGFKRIAPIFTYIDLSVILASVLLLCFALFNMFVEGVDDLVAKRYLMYGPEKGGDRFLQLLIVTYLYLPPLLLAGVAYGFYRGLRDGRLSFWKLLLATVLGFLGGILMVSIYYGEFVGLSNYQKVKEVMPESAPSGTTITSPGQLLGCTVGATVGYVVIGWLAGLLGSGIRRFQRQGETAHVSPS